MPSDDAPRDADLSLGTLSAKTWLDDQRTPRPLSVPVHQAVNFAAASNEALGKAFAADSDRVYARFGHPTLNAAGERIARLEGAEAGLVFGSGLGAIASTLVTLTAEAGAHVVAQRQIFGQTYTLLDGILRKFGVETTFVHGGDVDEVRGALRPETRLVYIESPANPTLQCVDIAAIAEVARTHGARLAVDGTFGTPALQRPLALGADVVVHSATKFLAGHSDVMCGAVVGSRELVDAIRETQVHFGTLLDPHAAWLLLRGMRTLHLRMERHSANALALARLLDADPRIDRVFYPHLKGSPGFELARRQMRLGGGVVSFVPAGGVETARRLVDALRLVPIATSLGGVESVVEIPTELDWSEDELGEAPGEVGIPPGLVRLSVGIEDFEDLEADFRSALERL